MVKNKKGKKVSGLSNIELLLFTIAIIICNGILLFVIIRPKFQDVTIELGTEEIDLNKFVTSKLYRKKAICLTDVNDLDLSVVGEQTVSFTYQGGLYLVKLIVRDTTSPKVKFKDLEVGSNYEFRVEDFVEEASDLSDFFITSSFKEDISKFGDYKVRVEVTDIYGNRTIGIRNLKIVFAKDSIKHEFGDEFRVEEFVINPDDYNKIDKDVLDKIDTLVVGMQNISYTVDGVDYKLVVDVEDTTPPTLEVRDITTYLGGKEKVYKDFVRKATDLSGEVTLSYEGNLDFNKVGVYELKITAKDIYNNETTEVAKLIVKADNIGPVFSGLSTITIEKGGSIDYKAGVSAKDAKDGIMDFSVDSSSVDVNTSGTYYAVYKASDLSSNTTTKKRKIVVKHNEEDTNAKFMEYYNKYLAGKSVLEMTKYVRNHLAFESKTRTDDALWEALTDKRASCYGRSLLLDKAFKQAGYESYSICTMPKYKLHCWNLVKVDGVWRHYDATPGTHSLGPLTDEGKLNSAGMYGRKWDTSLYPAAN